MKIHTQDFKNKIKTIRETQAIVTYNINGESITLNGNNIKRLKYSVNGDILKSIMKQLEIKVDRIIPKDTVLNLNIGVKTNNDYEYLNYGNFVVYEIEEEKETGYFNMLCYDKMLYSMKKYESLGVTYPISIRDYINAICSKLGLTFKDTNNIFANYNKTIPYELYLSSDGKSYGYTYRDVLDELAQVTASAICINGNDELEIRYFNQTNDTIDEDYLKNINVTFKEKYGAVNTIVLSRSAGTDNVYYPSPLPANPIEIKISDNQIMNRNDRDTYMPDIYAKLNGLEYYMNDFNSNGILYYEFYDIYDVSIGEETYKCLLLNDEITIESGLSETIYTNKPDTSVTDYEKASKTDRDINQVYLIVDKQNGTIDSVVSQTIDYSNPNSVVNQVDTLDGRVVTLEGEISNVTGMAQTKDSEFATVTFDDTTTASEPITIEIYPTSTNISYLYPNSSLYPSSTTYLKTRTLRFYNITTQQIVKDYPLPDDLLYYDSEHYDKFYLNLKTETCQIIKKCKYNADGTVGLLTNEDVIDYEYPDIPLTEGIYTILLLGYSAGHLSATLMTKNIYTDQFYTKMETDSIISQTAENITSSVTQTLTGYATTEQMSSSISQSALDITSTVSQNYETKNDALTKESSLSSRIQQTAKTISLTTSDNSTSCGITIKLYNEDGTQIGNDYDANITLSGLVSFTNLSTGGQTQISGANITTGTISADRISANSIAAEKLNITTLSSISSNLGSITGGSIQIGGNFSVDSNGKAQLSNSTGFLSMKVTTHPYVSALNIARGSGGISFRNTSSQVSAGNGVASISLETYKEGYSDVYALKIQPGGRLYIDDYYGQTIDRIIYKDSQGENKYMIFYKGLLVGYN